MWRAGAVGGAWAAAAAAVAGAGNSGHGRSGWSGGFMGSDLLVPLLQILFQDPDLVLHGVNQLFHLGVQFVPPGFSLSVGQQRLLLPSSGDPVFAPPSLGFCPRLLRRRPQHVVRQLPRPLDGVFWQFLGLTGELHDVFCPFLEVF